MLLGIGTDVLHFPRLVNLISRRSEAQLARRVLGASELEQFAALDASRRVRLLAVSWTLKEAAYKALYPTAKLTWKDLSVIRNEGGKPSLALASTLQSSLKVGAIHCSVSHDGDYVLAMVAIERSNSSS
ncbi:4'-phosphopantetheinyl transferase [Exidia glandulosa HHB12029]|uniref:4'-phosphopantetheinyl transferase n=1 Tax=Exidia glandulosa HHB12029 TaxID=1314781 RepID=A0A165QR60_EXIGL|nr:4'-phosphopantetheinyl transferase [Exidia glandulosa HHB12029]